MNKDYKEQLKELLVSYIYVGKVHSLSSGKNSSVYVDVKSLSLHPSGALLIPKILSTMIPNDTDFIGGTELGAVPLVSLLQSYLVHVKNRMIPSFVVRKKVKGYGLKKEIECPYSLRGNIVLIEDVITTGSTVLRAIQIVRPIKVICVVDREEYSPDFREYVHLVDPVFRLRDLI